MSKNVKVNETTYEGVSVVQLPLSDGSGNAEFKDVDEITTPSGSKTITENGTYDVSAYEQAVVNVPTSGGNESYIGLVDGSISGDIVLPDSINLIKGSAFKGTNITSISMKGVKEIGESAFYGCRNLILTKLPEVLEKIGNNAFYAATNVNISEIPASVKDMSGSYLFYTTQTKTLTFKGKPDVISASALGVVDVVNVPWAEGEVENAPWGAKTVNYNYVGE